MIVFISLPYFSPAFRAGGPIQSIANLVSYPIDGVTYYIFCSNIDLNGELINVPVLNKWSSYNSFTNVYYASAYNITKKLKYEVQHLQPTKFFIIGLFDFNFNLYPLLFIKNQNKILSVRGMLHPGALLQKKIKKSLFLNFLSLWGITNKVSFHATNNEESVFIKNIFGSKSNVNIANNLPKKIEPQSILPKEENFIKLVTIALISPMKNHLLVLKSLYNITTNVEYNIYGPIMDKNYWDQCKIVMTNLPPNIKVVYHGEIQPSNILTALNQSHVFIMPSQSENYGHAIAEALLAGKPVITSFNTPWSNLKENNTGYNVNLETEDIVKAILFFANTNNEEYAIFSKSSSAYAIKKSNASEVLNDYKKMFFN